MIKQQLFKKFETLCDGDLNQYKQFHENNIREYSYYIYKNINNLAIKDLNKLDVMFNAKQILLKQAEKLNYKEIMQYLKDYSWISHCLS